MAARTYQNFDLSLEAAGESSFRARVAYCPAGDSPSITFSLPFDGTQLEMLMLKLDPGRSGTRRAGIDPQRQASLDLGGALFEAVFRDEVLLAWSRSQDLTRTAGQGLRLRLRLTDAPPIAGLPWELLYDRTRQQLPGPVRAHAAGAVPRRAAGAATDGRRRPAAHAGRSSPRPSTSRARRRGRVAIAAGGVSTAGRRPALVVLDRLPARPCPSSARGCGARRRTSCTSSATATSTTGLREGVIYFQDQYGRSIAVTRRRSARTCATTTRCGWWFLTPAGRPAPTPPTRSAGWRRGWSSRTPPRSSPCSSRSATARR